MLGVFWVSALVGLLLLHYAVLPRLGVLALKIAPSATHIPHHLATRYLLFWSGSIAIFTAIVYTTSVIVWRQGAYLGTLFYLAAPIIWLFNWLTGKIQNDPADSEAFDVTLRATLMGSLLGTAVGWAISRLL